MEFGISTASFFPREGTEDAAARIHALGADCAEVFLQTFSEYSRAFGERLRGMAPELSVRSVHVMTTQVEMGMFSRGKRQREESWDLFRGALDAGQAMGADYYVMHGLTSTKNPQYVPDIPMMLDVLRPALDMAAERGIALTLENVHWCMCRRPETVRYLCEALPGLYYTLDIKQAWQGDCDPLDFLEAMGPNLRNVHVCDRDETGNTCLPGRGKADFPELFARLRGIGYNGAIILEVYEGNYARYEELAESLDYLRGLISAY